MNITTYACAVEGPTVAEPIYDHDGNAVKDMSRVTKEAIKKWNKMVDAMPKYLALKGDLDVAERLYTGEA